MKNKIKDIGVANIGMSILAACGAAVTIIYEAILSRKIDRLISSTSEKENFEESVDNIE